MSNDEEFKREAQAHVDALRELAHSLPRSWRIFGEGG